MPAPILATKLYIPSPRQHFVNRPRLVDRLNAEICQSQGGGCKLTLISAPAGFGKTSLVSNWLRSGGHVAAWLSLDESDNHLTRFLRYVVAALHQAYPEIGGELAQIVEDADIDVPEPFLAELIHEIEAATATATATLNNSLTRKFILVLDDYHLISAEPVHQALRYLLEHLPRSLHLLLTTRADPPLPLARMRVRQELNEIRADALRFLPDEVDAFFNPFAETPLSSALLQQLASRTEGWVAGMQLAGLTLQGLDATQAEQFIQELTGTDRYISDYLLDEVLLRQPDEVRTFLLQTSILDRLSPALCDAVTQQTNSHALLRQLEAGNFFLIALDHVQQWYRYHHLFLDLLRAQLSFQQPALMADYHGRACDWYASHEMISEALHHAFAAEDTERAAQLVAQNAFEFALRGEIEQPLSWLNQLPDHVIAQSALLSLTYAWIMSFTSEFDRIESHLQNVEAQLGTLDESLSHSFQLQIGLLRSFVSSHRGDPEKGLADGEQLLGLIPPQETRLRATALLILAEGYNVLGRINDIVRVLGEAVPLFQKSNAYTLTLISASGLALGRMIQGRLRSAEQVCREVLAWAEAEGLQKLPATAMMLVNLGEVCREQNRLEEAEQYLAEGNRLAELSSFAPAGSDGYWSLGQLRRGQRDWAAAETAFDRALSIRPGDYGPSTVAMTTQKVRLWIEMGAGHLADDWANNSALSLSDNPTMVHDLEYIALCRHAMAHGNTHAALDMLNKLQTVATEDGRMSRVIEALVLQSIVWETQDKTDQAMGALTKALRLGKPEGYVRIFVDEGEAIVPILRRLASAGVEPEYVTSLLQALQDEHPTIHLVGLAAAM